jgi:hypothetical protein
MKPLTTYNIKQMESDTKTTSVTIDTYLITILEEVLGTTKLLNLINDLYRKNLSKVNKEFTMVRLISNDLMRIIVEKSNLNSKSIEAIYQYKQKKATK